MASQVALSSPVPVPAIESRARKPKMLLTACSGKTNTMSARPMSVDSVIGIQDSCSPARMNVPTARARKARVSGLATGRRTMRVTAWS